MYLFEDGTKTLCDISQFWAGIDSFLWLIGEAVFHMLPVGICWSVTRKMGTTQMLGIVLGLTLVSGQLLNAYAVAETAAADIPKWNFGAFQVNMIGYQGQVLPAMLRQKGFTYFRLMADIYQLGKPAFREYSIFFHDELEIKNKEGNDPIDPHTGLLSSTTAISYRSEPMRNRMPVSHDPADSGEESVEAGT